MILKEFKPKKTEKVVISIRINSNTLEMLDLYSNKNKMSRNELIVQCIDFALDNLK